MGGPGVGTYRRRLNDSGPIRDIMTKLCVLRHATGSFGRRHSSTGAGGKSSRRLDAGDGGKIGCFLRRGRVGGCEVSGVSASVGPSGWSVCPGCVDGVCDLSLLTTPLSMRYPRPVLKLSNKLPT